MRIATYNIEWFNALFDDDGELIDDDGWSARHNITRSQQTEAVGIVLTALKADAIMIIEAPDQNRRRSTVRALEGFAYRMGLSARKAVLETEALARQLEEEAVDVTLPVALPPRGRIHRCPIPSGSSSKNFEITGSSIEAISSSLYAVSP